MRIASLVRAAVLSNNLRTCSAQQGRLLGGDFLCKQLSICNTSSWERWIHSGSRVLPSCHIWQWERQSGTQESWLAKDQKSWASSSTAAATQVNSSPATQVNSSPKPKVQQPVVYRGPLSDTLRKVKLLSLTSCCLSIITGPAIVFLTSPHLSVILKGGVACAVMMLSASTTAALHWFVGPYVHKMTWIPGSKEIEVQMVTWMATYETRIIPIEDLRPPKTNRPFVSFAAKNRFYFVDPDKVPNKDLLRLVTFYQNQK